MKKIILTVSDITTFGGVQRVVANLSSLLANYYDVTVVSFYKKNKAIPYQMDKRVIVDYINDSEEFSGKGFLQKLYYKNLAKIICSLTIYRKYKDVTCIVASCWDFFPHFKHSHTKYIKFIHLNFQRYSKRNNLFDSLVILSPAEIHVWRKYHSDVNVIPNFIANVASSCATYANKQILAVGRFEHQKGFLRLVEIYAKIAYQFPDWQLRIVGDGSQKAEIINKIAELKVSDFIQLADFTDEIEPEYVNASIYAMTSYFEGFPMVLLEASSYGLPMVAFDVKTGPRDIIVDGVNGYLIPDGDVELYVDALSKLMTNLDLRVNFGNSARENLTQHFSGSVIGEKWRQLIEK